jgi:hypothetical protein
VAHRDRQVRVVGEALKFSLPPTVPIAITAAPVRRDEQVSGPRIEAAALSAPPPADRGDGKSARIVIGADVDEARVPA